MDWGIGPPSQEYKCPPDAASSPPISRIAFCQMNPSCKSATSGGRQCKYIWFIGAGEKWFLGVARICQPGKSSVPPKPKDGLRIRGGEFGRRCFFLSDRNSASFPVNCKTLGRKRVQIFVGRTFFIQQRI